MNTKNEKNFKAFYLSMIYCAKVFRMETLYIVLKQSHNLYNLLQFLAEKNIDQ